MAKLICEKCGELPIPLSIPNNIENDETMLKQFGKKLIAGVKCAKCKNPVKLIRGNLTSKFAIKESQRLKDIVAKYSMSANPDAMIHRSNELVMNRLIKELSGITSLFFHKNILVFILVGENSLDGCITYNTKTIYSGIYSIFPDIKNSLLENSLNAIKKQQQTNIKLPANKIIDFIELQDENMELKKEIVEEKKKFKQKLNEFEIRISNQYSELSKKQNELNHFKELYNDLKK